MKKKNESTLAPGVGLGVEVSYPIRVDTTFVPTAFSPIVLETKKKKKKKSEMPSPSKIKPEGEQENTRKYTVEM